MINSGLYTSKTDEWATPQAFFENLDQEFHFTLDVCANDENHKCKLYYTKADDGLKMNWGGAYYMVQPTLWSRNRQMGREMCESRWHSCDAVASSHRYKMVPRLYLWQSRNKIYQRTAQVWRCNKLGTVPVYGSNLQKGGI